MIAPLSALENHSVVRILLLSVFLTILGVGQTQAQQGHTTEDWSRREAFVNPLALGEKAVHDWQGGRWQAQTLSGTFRFIITDAGHGKEKLYIQWLVAGKEVAYSLSIKELNMRPEYDLDIPRCISEYCDRITVSAKHVYESTERDFQLHLNGLGQYAFLM